MNLLFLFYSLRFCIVMWFIVSLKKKKSSLQSLLFSGMGQGYIWIMAHELEQKCNSAITSIQIQAIFCRTFRFVCVANSHKRNGKREEKKNASAYYSRIFTSNSNIRDEIGRC